MALDLRAGIRAGGGSRPPFWGWGPCSGTLVRLVTCPSGRRCNTRNVVWCQSQRGFKSHRHRQIARPWFPLFTREPGPFALPGSGARPHFAPGPRSKYSCGDRRKAQRNGIQRCGSSHKSAGKCQQEHPCSPPGNKPVSPRRRASASLRRNAPSAERAPFHGSAFLLCEACSSPALMLPKTASRLGHA